MNIQPYKIAVSDDDLNDLQQRLVNARWPGDIANEGWHYGCQQDFLKTLVSQWQSFDWRAAEAQMNSLPHFMTEVDGQPLHFVHIKNDKPALVLMGGWPWTFWDFEEVIEGLRADYDLIIPELPGYGFSTPLKNPKTSFVVAADMIHRLVTEGLGYAEYGVYGGDWGSLTAEQLAHKYPEQVTGLHVSMPFPLDFAPIDPSLWSAEEGPYAELTAAWWQHGTAYFQMHASRPQTVAYLNDSPIAMAAWIVEKLHGWSDHEGDLYNAYARDKMLANLSIYWFTQSIGSSARFYAESLQNPWTASYDGEQVITVPTAITAFPKEVAQAPRAWAESYFNLTHYHRPDKGGHFPAVETPATLIAEIKTFFSAKD